MIKKIPVTFLLTIACLVCTLASCKFRQKVALIVHHAKIYTVDEKFSVAEAMAVNEGKIIAIGKNDDILKQYESDSLVDAGGKTILPGFNDVHAHFVGYAYSLKEVNLVDTKSWDEVLARCSEFEKKITCRYLANRPWMGSK
ncbi:MAG: amidohydrolase family protein [Ferruginibacter sp.]